MKKIISLILTLVIVLSCFGGCVDLSNDSKANETNKPGENSTEVTTEPSTTTPDEKNPKEEYEHLTECDDINQTLHSFCQNSEREATIFNILNFLSTIAYSDLQYQQSIIDYFTTMGNGCVPYLLKYVALNNISQNAFAEYVFTLSMLVMPELNNGHEDYLSYECPYRPEDDNLLTMGNTPMFFVCYHIDKMQQLKNQIPTSFSIPDISILTEKMIPSSGPTPIVTSDITVLFDWNEPGMMISTGANGKLNLGFLNPKNLDVSVSTNIGTLISDYQSAKSNVFSSTFVSSKTLKADENTVVDSDLNN